LSRLLGMISSWPGELSIKDVGRAGFRRGGDGEPLFTVKRLESGRVGAGGEGDCDADSNNDLVFWKKLFPGIEGDGTGVRAVTIVRSVGRRGIRDAVGDTGSCSELWCERVAETGDSKFLSSEY
jgi:hypothetical protein